MIIEEYNESLFIQRFENYNRVITPENKNGNFSYNGLRYLFEYLDNSYDEENPYKLDVISLCCEFSEYENLKEFLGGYYSEEQKRDLIEEYTGQRDFEKLNDDEMTELKECVENLLNDERTLIKFGDDLDDGFIIY